MNRKTIMFFTTDLIIIMLAVWVLVPVVVRAMPDAPRAGAPGLISYQGFLADSDGAPLTGQHDLTLGIYAASSGGNALWEDTFNDQDVSNGYFTVVLGSGAALTSAVFNGTETWLQVTVDGSATPLPRQRIAAVPYALQAQAAQSADTAPWSGLTGMPAGFADGMDAGQHQNVKYVAKNCQDGGTDECYLTIQAALDSITDSSETNPYVVWIAPGTYEGPIDITDSYVTIKGIHAPAVTITGVGSPNPDRGTVNFINVTRVRLADLSVTNTGGNIHAIGVYMIGTSYSYLENVSITAQGAAYHYGWYTSGCWGVGVFATGIWATGEASSADVQYGVYNYDSVNTGSGISLNRQSLVSATGGAASYGIYNQTNGLGTNVYVRYSTVSATTNTVRNDTNYTLRGEYSRFEGGPVTGAGTITCTYVEDENYSPISPPGCP